MPIVRSAFDQILYVFMYLYNAIFFLFSEGGHIIRNAECFFVATSFCDCCLLRISMFPMHHKLDRLRNMPP